MKKAIIFLVALIACLLPFTFAASGDLKSSDKHVFNVTVRGESNIQIYNISLNFSDCLPDTVNCETKAISLNISNTGNQEPSTDISAAVLTINGTSLLRGFESVTPAGQYFFNASNLQLNSVPLNSSVTLGPVVVVLKSALPRLALISVPASISIPAGQEAAHYTAQVRFNWSS